MLIHYWFCWRNISCAWICSSSLSKDLWWIKTTCTSWHLFPYENHLSEVSIKMIFLLLKIVDNIVHLHLKLASLFPSWLLVLIKCYHHYLIHYCWWYHDWWYRQCFTFDRSFKVQSRWDEMSLFRFHTIAESPSLAGSFHLFYLQSVRVNVFLSQTPAIEE